MSLDPTQPLAAHVTPSGQLVLDAASEADGLDLAARARLIDAMAQGAGHAVLMLGLAHVESTLCPSLALLRELGKRFATRLCAEPEWDQQQTPEPQPEELAALLAALPPMLGAEHVSGQVLRGWWEATASAFRVELQASGGGLQEWLRSHGSAWNAVGKVCFHLAENPAEPEYPFAFLATYATRPLGKGKVAYAPLSRALAESSARGDTAGLLSLLVPVQRAAERSTLVKQLLDDGDLYHPLAWSPAEAHEFLREIPALEDAGVLVRVPDWWRSKRPPRPQVQVTLGGKAPGAGTLSAETLLEFDVGVTLDGEKLDASELRELLNRQEGLALVRGKWVELDREKLHQVLEHWQRVEHGDGVSFLTGLRLLAGAPGLDRNGPEESTSEWTRVEAGPWLAQALAGLRAPDGLPPAAPEETLRAELRPYQQTGVSWLRFASRLRLGVCLADDMGLGKTIQILALMLVEKREAPASAPHLLVVPASLLGNWQAEAARFAPSLRLLVAHSSALKELAVEPSLAEVDVVLTTYGTAARVPWINEHTWSLLVLDEAQAIKNANTRQARAVKALRARSRIALTGTPVENRLGDLWSLFDFLAPGLLGTPKQFSTFQKKLAERKSEPYAPLRRLVQPYLLRRLKTDPRVVSDLPDKTELKAYCGLARAQAALYQRTVTELAAALRDKSEGIERRGVVLAYLTRFKQICNHPAHWLRDGAWNENESGKLQRLRALAEEIAARQEKLLVFTQFREASEPLAAFLEQVFGRPGLILHGGTPVKQRGELVARFQNDEQLPFFVLSLKAGGTGLNLTAASHVVHFDRWWNPAVENQATDRAFRIGQRRNVLVHKMICRGTVEEKIDALIDGKKDMAQGIMGEGGAETLLTELDDEQLLALVALDVTRATTE